MTRLAVSALLSTMLLLPFYNALPVLPVRPTTQTPSLGVTDSEACVSTTFFSKPINTAVQIKLRDPFAAAYLFQGSCVLQVNLTKDGKLAAVGPAVAIAERFSGPHFPAGTIVGYINNNRKVDAQPSLLNNSGNAADDCHQPHPDSPVIYCPGHGSAWKDYVNIQSTFFDQTGVYTRFSYDPKQTNWLFKESSYITYIGTTISSKLATIQSFLNIDGTKTFVFGTDQSGQTVVGVLSHPTSDKSGASWVSEPSAAKNLLTVTLPETTTASPSTTPVSVEPSTAPEECYEETTQAAEQTTVAAEQSTQAAKQSTQTAEQTTEAAEQTTQAAEQTTQAAEQTTQAAAQTTQPAAKTNVAPAPRPTRKANPNKKQEVRDLLKAIETGAKEPFNVIDPKHYIQHNPAATEGLAGVAALMESLKKTARVEVKRVFQDGDYVFAHTDYNFFGPKFGFDIFRYENGFIVEHWDNLQTKPSALNPSKHSMIDGTIQDTQTVSAKDAAANKETVLKYLEENFVKGNTTQLGSFFDRSGTLIQHNPLMGDGVNTPTGLRKSLSDAAKAGKTVKYSKVHKVLGEGNFVLAVSEATRAGEHLAV
ncbi:hypothetical protein BV898_01461 [Hypsibius exemplaris]|uniref:SnoaL-like domain-containing protein n=1 Tax=Hypsibius exemplaris TaxID=2072580 RepID=A0A1W0XBI6_HYPEX|nr:hypothetical protein BV898_01461 [Hypsibius exemplaris]